MVDAKSLLHCVDSKVSVLFAQCGRQQYQQPGDAYHVPLDTCVF